MNMFDWYKKGVIDNYANFSGRARRSEYWYFTLCNFLISMAFYIPLIASIGFSESGEPTGVFWFFYVLFMLYNLAVLIPSIAVAVRRLHDINKSGWNYLFGIIPLVGPIILLVWFCTDSDIFENKWGPNPKSPSDQINEIGVQI